MHEVENVICVSDGHDGPRTANTGSTHQMTSEASSNPAAGTVLVRATRSESAGSGLRIAGLSIIERSLKQLAALNLRIVLATDGSCSLPVPLPSAVEIRTLVSPQDMERLRTELRAKINDVPEVGADEVRPGGRDLTTSIRVTDKESRKQAEDAVFAQLLCGNLGFVARYLNKPVSFRITRYLLCHLPITPNQITLVAALFGLLGVALVASGQHWLMLAGFFLVQTQSILDGCDGELARVRLQQSKIGEWLDSSVDEIINLLLFASIGIGLWRASGSHLALAVGLLAAAIHLFYDILAVSELKRLGEGGDFMRIRWWLTGGLNMKDRASQKRGGLIAIVHGLGRRDFFIFAFLLYALAGEPFLALVNISLIAVGELILTCGQIVWYFLRQSEGEG
jgi:phosphatidylglycerophosphate synthase